MAARPLRLLLVSPLPPPTGGVSIWTRSLLASDVAQRVRIRVVDTAPPDAVNQAMRFNPQRILTGAAILGDALRAALLERPDVAHINTAFGWAVERSALLIELLRASGVPTLLHLHGGAFVDTMRARQGPRRAVALRALRRAHRVIVMERSAERFLRCEVGAERVTFLPNFTDPAWLGPMPPDRERPAPVRILFVGWVMPAKGVLDLLSALAMVPEAHLDIVGPFVPAGQVDSRSAVMERMRERGVTERVTLHGELDRGRLLQMFERADLLALPSHREGIPLVVIEAMAAGLPVVASTVGGLPDIIADGQTGLLVPPGDVGALAERLRRLTSDVALRHRMGAAAQAYARAHLTVFAVAPQLEALWMAAAERS